MASIAQKTPGSTFKDLLTVYDGDANEGLETSLKKVFDGEGIQSSIQLSTDDFNISTHDSTKGLYLGGTLVTATAAELNTLSGVTSGTVLGSKAIIVDSSKDATGMRNLTITGEITGEAPSQSANDNSKKIANTAYVKQEIDAMIASAPAALDTLNELAAALNDDASFSSTVTNSLALKAPLASPSFTGNIGLGTSSPASSAGLSQFLEISGDGASGIILTDTTSSTPASYEIWTDANRLRFWDDTYGDVLTLNAGKVGIGTTSPSDYFSTGDDLVVYNSSHCGITIATGDASSGHCEIYFADGTSNTNQQTEGRISYGHDNNDMTFRTNHSDQVIIDSSGNVGIGVTSPASKLNLPLENDASTPTLSFGDGDSGIYEGADDNLYISTAGSDAMKISSTNVVYCAGSVGIGTASPGYPLDVNGKGRFVDEIFVTGTNPKITITDTSAGHDDFTIDVNADTWMLNQILNVTSGGNVGIGTTSPNAQLHIQTTSGADSGQGVVVENSSNEEWAFMAGIIGQTSNGASIYDKNNAAVRMSFLNNGNVGIGETSPDKPLHITNTGDTPLKIEHSDGTGVYIELRNNAGAGYIGSSTDGLVFLTTASGTERMRILSGGNVGIGTTSPSTILNIHPEDAGDGIQIDETDSTNRALRLLGYDTYGLVEVRGFDDITHTIDGANGVVFNENSRDMDFRVESDGNSNMLFVDGGNNRVGIGTASPSVELEVDGDIKCDDINVQYDYIRVGIDYDQSAGTLLALPLDGTRGYTTFAGNLEKCCMIAPHDGTLDFIQFRSEEVPGNPVVIGFHKQVDGTEVPSDTADVTVSLDMSALNSENRSTKFNFTTSNTFSAGDVLGFSIDPANDINECLFVICLKYDTTT